MAQYAVCYMTSHWHVQYTDKYIII